MSAHKIPFSVVSLRTQERARNSRGQRAISARAIEILLYFEELFTIFNMSMSIILKMHVIK